MARTMGGLILGAFAIGAALIFATDLVRLFPRALGGSKPAVTQTLYQMQLLSEGRKSLPSRVDEVTVLESLDFDGATLVYGYTASVGLRADLDMEAFKTAGLPTSCRTLDDAFRPGEVEAIRHHYRFTDGETLDVTINRVDCSRAVSGGAAPDGGNFIADFEKSTGIDLSR